MNKYACEMNERAEINSYTIYVNKRVIIHVYIYSECNKKCYVRECFITNVSF